MAEQVLTEVRATVDEDVADRLVAGFLTLVESPVAAGLLRSELLRGPGGEWRIQTLWRDRAALEAMRAGSEPPAAPALFRSVGADPTLQIWDVISGHEPNAGP